MTNVWKNKCSTGPVQGTSCGDRSPAGGRVSGGPAPEVEVAAATALAETRSGLWRREAPATSAAASIKPRANRAPREVIAYADRRAGTPSGASVRRVRTTEPRTQ